MEEIAPTLDYLSEHFVELIGLVSALLAIAVIFIQRQLRINRPKPRYRIGADPDNIATTLRKGGKPTDRKTERALQGEHVFYPVFLDAREQRKFGAKRHFFYFPIHIENKGSAPIEHLQVQLDYPSRHRANYDDLTNVFPGGEVKQVQEDEKVATYRITAEEEVKDDPYRRRAVSSFGFTQVLYDVPLVRPGERLTIYEVLQLPHEGACRFSEMNFEKSGYDAISEGIDEIKEVRNNFPMVVYFRSVNNSPIVKRSIIFSIHGDPNGSSDAVDRYVVAHWMGRMPPKGLYSLPPFGFTRLMRRLGLIGMLSRSWSREHPIIFHSTKAYYKKRDNEETFSFDDPRPSLIGFGTLVMPNIDFFAIPDGIRTTKDLVQWLGFAPWPRALGGPRFESDELKDVVGPPD